MITHTSIPLTHFSCITQTWLTIRDLKGDVPKALGA